MSPSAEAREAWGVLNPAGARARNGSMHLFPRLVAEGNVSCIGDALVEYKGETPVAVERLRLALEPREVYERDALGGGVEDPRVTFIAALDLYVMTYTAYVPRAPRVAVAVSNDLLAWRRLGLMTYAPAANGTDLNECTNKDATFFPHAVRDGSGVESLACLHRPTKRIEGGATVPGGSKFEHIWISYVPLELARRDVNALTSIGGHEEVMAPVEAWEHAKIGAGAPPIRLPYGWLLLYHGVSAASGHPRYCAGAAILDAERPSRVLYRTPEPILEPETAYERVGTIPDVVFPTAADLRSDGTVDVYYGAADRVIAAASLSVPAALPGAGAPPPVGDHVA